MESLVEGSDINLHNRESKECCQNAPDSVKERKTDDIRYHWIVVLKGAGFFFSNTGVVKWQEIISTSDVKHCKESNSQSKCSNKSHCFK